MKAWIVFTKEADIWYLKLLKVGFRHCYVLLNNGKNWVSIESLSNGLIVSVLDYPVEKDLPLWTRRQGHIVLRVDIQKFERKVLPFSWVSCVEVAKRVIGLRYWWVWTPYQLYRHLLKTGKGSEKLWGSKRLKAPWR